nr:DMT family transporter [uncultured Halomonas sp.]
MAPITQEPQRRTDKTWLIALLSLLGTGACIGLSTNLAKLADSANISALAFLAWSILGATGVLFTVALLRGKLPPFNLRTLEYFIVAALVTVAGSNLIFFSAIPEVGVSFVTLVITLPPLMTYIGAIAFKIERFQIMRAAGVLTALIGTAVLAINKLNAPDAPVFWILLALTGPVLLAIGNLYRTLRWPIGVTAEALAPGMLGAATLMLFTVGLLPGFSTAVPMDNRLPLLLILAQATVFALQFLLLFVLQKSGGPVLISLMGAVGAVIGVPIAIYLLGEAPPEGLILGSVFIAAGIALVTLGKTATTSR